MERSVFCESSTCTKCPVKCHRQPTIAPTPKEDALRMLFENSIFTRKTEWIPLSESLGRVTAEDIFAALNVPNMAESVSDGVAVNHDFAEARLLTGNHHFDTGEYQKVGMGMPLAFDADTVIPVEQVMFSDAGIDIRLLPPKGNGVNQPGHNVKRGQKLLPANHRLAPANLGILRYSGVEKIPVLKKPVAAIIAVGNELIEAGNEPGPGQKIESDSIMMEAIVAACGGDSCVYSIVPDHEEMIGQALLKAADEWDWTIIIGGAGEGGANFGDYVTQAVQATGRLLVKCTSAGPGGKPQFMAVVRDKPVLGIPGPMHAAITQAEIYIPAVMAHFLGVLCYEREELMARIAKDASRSAKPGHHPHVLVKWTGSEYEMSFINMGDNPDCFAYANAILVPDNHAEPGELVKVRLVYGERSQRIKGTEIY